MSTQKTDQEQTRRPAKRMLATGRKINGTWEVRTFLRKAADDKTRTLWETITGRAAS